MGPGRAAGRLFDAVIIQRDDDMTITNCTAGVGIGYESVFDGGPLDNHSRHMYGIALVSLLDGLGLRRAGAGAGSIACCILFCCFFGGWRRRPVLDAMYSRATALHTHTHAHARESRFRLGGSWVHWFFSTADGGRWAHQRGT